MGQGKESRATVGRPAQVGLRTDNQVTRNRGPGTGGVPGGAPGSGSGSGQRQLEVGTEGSIVSRLLPWPLVLLAGSGEP